MNKAVLGFLIVGTLLRVIWPSDMEWKRDEKFLFSESQRIAVQKEPWPPTGEICSQGFANPGLSMWTYMALGYIAHDPVSMVTCVALINVLALWLFYFFITKQVPEERRFPWLWGLALFAVSPVPVLYARKIWSPCVLSIFLFLFYFGHWNRKTRWGAWLWGFAAPLLGQIHISGFFFGGVVFVATAFRDRALKNKTRWKYWLLGSAIGALGLVPWLLNVHFQSGNGTEHHYWHEVLRLKFFGRFFEEAWGLDFRFQFRKHFWTEFIREPVLFGVPTFLVFIAHVFLVTCGLFVIGRWAYRKLKGISESRERTELRFYIGCCFWGYGLVMTLMGVRIYPHYLMILYPIVHLWVADVLQKNGTLLRWVLISQLLITSSALVYIHRVGGVADGEYGPTYRIQNNTSQQASSKCIRISQSVWDNLSYADENPRPTE